MEQPFSFENEDAVFLYNVSQKKFLSKIQLFTDSDTDYLTAFPLLTDDPNNAGILIISVANNNPTDVLFRATTGTVGDRIYLGSSSSQSILYMAPNNPQNITWTLQHTKYGRPTHIQNTASLLYLQSSPSFNINDNAPLQVYDTWINVIASDVLQSQADDWILIPTFPLYVCNSSTNDCSQSIGVDNAFSQLYCDGKDQCRDRFNQQIFLTQKNCEKTCGNIIQSPNLLSSTLPSSSFSKSSSTTSSSFWSISTLIGIGLGILLFFILFYIIKRYGKRQ